MKLRIVTPLSMVVEEDDILALRARDASGSFGILPGHADFLTSLSICVIDWKRRDGARHFCAVRRGVLAVREGREIGVATREAIAGDALATLENVVITRFRAEIDAERSARIASTQLQLSAIRQIMNHLRPDGHHRATDFA